MRRKLCISLLCVVLMAAGCSHSVTGPPVREPDNVTVRIEHGALIAEAVNGAHARGWAWQVLIDADNDPRTGLYARGWDYIICQDEARGDSIPVRRIVRGDPNGWGPVVYWSHGRDPRGLNLSARVPLSAMPPSSAPLACLGMTTTDGDGSNGFFGFLWAVEKGGR